MGTEIERKYLLTDDRWRAAADTGTRYQQGYLSGDRNCSIRVRIEGERAALNIKSATLGIQRHEYEYEIPLPDARQLLELFCPDTVSKTRYHVDYAGKTWEIDVFEGRNAGLVVAEVELDSIDETLELPPWVGVEVSGQPRYYNTELARHPFLDWDESERRHLYG
jgi:adenylate cyclase